MSDYQEYLLEREKIDHMLEKGYAIKDVQENVSGAFLTFEKLGEEAVTLHIKTADARKYFSNLIFQARQNV